MSPKKLSFKRAAEKILSQSDIPLSPKEIVDRALENELIGTEGQTPDATMGAQLYMDIRKNPSSPFKKVGRGKFSLKDAKPSASSAALTIDNQNHLVRESLHSKLFAMEPEQFEILVAEFLEKLGYENVIVTGRSGDRGIDVTATLTMGGITSVKTIVQVKRYKDGNNIGGNVIAQLRGSAEVDQRGLVITTSDFTKEGIIEASAPNKMPMSLVNGNKLLDMLIQFEIGVKKELMPVYSLDLEYFENTTSDVEVEQEGVKRRGLWPLPGGIDAYVNTLFMALNKIGDSSIHRPELVKWFMKEFPKVKSEKTANGYVNVLRSIGMTKSMDGKFKLTTDGKHVFETKDCDVLYLVIAKNILGIEEIVEFLKTAEEPQSEANVMNFLKENLGVEWTTFAQVNFRLLWLVNLGKVRRVEGRFTI